MWRAPFPRGLRAAPGAAPLSSGGAPRALEGKVALVTAGTDGHRRVSDPKTAKFTPKTPKFSPKPAKFSPKSAKFSPKTAGTDRIGLGVAEALGVAGAQVLISSRRAQNVQRAVERLRGRGLQVSGVTCHVGRAEERERMVQAALDTFGAIDILVSNAAVNPHFGPALEADESTWDKVFQVNVTAAAMLVRLVVPHMEKRGGGAIVLMSSIAGYQPMTGLGPYSVSKAALLGLVAALSPELLPRGIRVNGVAPGLVRTRFSAALWEDEATRERALRELGVQRLGTPQEVAQAVLFLVSPQASYVAGHTLLVAGGARPRL